MTEDMAPYGGKKPDHGPLIGEPDLLTLCEILVRHLQADARTAASCGQEQREREREALKRLDRLAAAGYALLRTADLAGETLYVQHGPLADQLGSFKKVLVEVDAE